MKLGTAQVVQILMVATALVAVIVLQRPCARSVSRFVTSFDQLDGGAAVVRADAGAPTNPDGVILRGDMTPAEIEAAIAKARAEAASTLDGGVAPNDAAGAAATLPPR